MKTAVAVLLAVGLLCASEHVATAASTTGYTFNLPQGTTLEHVYVGVADGSLKVRIDRRYPIADAAQAHRDLASRSTSGKLLLDIE